MSFLANVLLPLYLSYLGFVVVLNQFGGLFHFSHGEICAMETLRPSGHSLRGLGEVRRQNSASSFLYQSAMVAMASFTKVIVVVLQPHFRVVFWQHLKAIQLFFFSI